MGNANKTLLREIVGGESYEYYPLGKYIVAAPGVCGGRPTFKYTRIDVRHALGLLAAGRTIEEVATGYQISIEAVKEALFLASYAFDQHVEGITKVA
jgi:uncharacterized protein (DUF433 family)